MSDEKPSPGPWRWEKDGPELSLLSATGEPVLEADRDLVWMPGYEKPTDVVLSSADAALIADAPAMLGLLRRREWGPDAGFCEECGMHGAPGLKHDSSCAWGAILDKHGRG